MRCATAARALRPRVAAARDRTAPLVAVAVAALALAARAAVGATAEVDAPPRVEIARIAPSEAPRIDGRLDDPVWTRAARIADFVQVEPVEGAPASQATDVRLATDGRTLFVGVRCFDDQPERIVAQLLARDVVLGEDDLVSIALSPFHDRRTGYLFQVNALGARRDALVEDQAQRVEWDGIWRAKARIDARGWTAEIAIPFATVAFERGEEVWGLNVQRVIRRNLEIVRWASHDVDRRFIHFIEMGELAGMRDLEQGLGIDAIPTATARVRDDPGNTGRSTFSFDPSLDVFVKPSPRVTGVVTVNTDFSETEVDDFAVNLTRFPLFFPEKRDFFLQDAGIFDFGGLADAANGRPFYSRRIGLAPNGEPVDLWGGTKWTGRVGRVSFGLLDVQQRSFRRADASGAIDRVGSQNLGVARATVDVLEESRIGAIATVGHPHRDLDAWLVGADWLFRTSRLFGDQQLDQRLWILKSDTEGAGGRDLAWGARIAYPNDAVSFSLEYRELQERFAPALGRAPRPGTRSYGGSLQLRQRTEGALRFVEGGASAGLFTDLDNVAQTRDVDAFAAVEGRIGDRLELRYAQRFDRVPATTPAFAVAGVPVAPGDYTWHSGALVATSAAARPLQVTLLVGAGAFYDGERYDVEPSLVARAGPHWVLALAMRNVWVELPAGSGTVRTASARLGWQPTPDFLWSTLVQWRDDSDRVGIQSRAQWIVTPGREVYFVLTQDVLDVDADPRRGPTVAVAKLGWTFRF